MVAILLSCKPEKQNIEHLIFKGEIAFKPDSDKPYTGEVFGLDDDGQIYEEGFYKNGKRDGKFKKFYELASGEETPKLEEEYSFKNGLKDGEAKHFFRNGKIFSLEAFKNGELDGMQKTFFENGDLESERRFTNGKPEGLHKY